MRVNFSFFSIRDQNPTSDSARSWKIDYEFFLFISAMGYWRRFCLN